MTEKHKIQILSYFNDHSSSKYIKEEELISALEIDKATLAGCIKILREEGYISQTFQDTYILLPPGKKWYKANWLKKYKYTKEFKSYQTPGNKMLTRGLLIGFAIGILLLLGGLVKYFEIKYFLSTAIHTEATITDVEWKYTTETTYPSNKNHLSPSKKTIITRQVLEPHYTITYYTNTGEKLIRYLGTINIRYKINDKVKIIYGKNNPKRVQIEGYDEFGSSMALVFFGLIATAISGGGYLIVKKVDKGLK